MTPSLWHRCAATIARKFLCYSNRRMRFRLAVVSLLLLASCGKLKELPTDPGSGTPPPDPTATFTRVKAEILPTCAAAGCHGTIAPQESLVLAPNTAYANIVNVPSVENSSIKRVAPGDPNNSYLYRKLLGSGITGDRMPLGGPYLSDAQIGLVRDWIRRGAPND